MNLFQTVINWVKCMGPQAADCPRPAVGGKGHACKATSTGGRFLLGALLGISPVAGACGGGHDHAEHATPAESNKAGQVWTCSMHPQIQLPGPGKCPICHMDLIPLKEDSGKDHPRRLSMGESARALAGIRTAPAQRQAVPVEVRMSGQVMADETRRKVISSYVDGRIERMFVAAAGLPVKEGEHLVTLYSPDLLVAQDELIQAEALARRIPSADSNRTRDAAREKLRLWGLADPQIDKIARSGRAQDRITLQSPLSGMVIEKHMAEGEYVMMGGPIYTLADLSNVWAVLDAYESDMNWLRYGQEVEVQVEALPGEVIKSRIALIEPTLDPMTRTTKVRINLDNKDGRLRPGYFVSAIVRPKVGANGTVVATELEGKHLCPMHPEVVQASPGECPVCGMDLVTAESLGYVTHPEPANVPLVIPATAPLITGTRAVVYVKVPGQAEPTYEGREIVLGPRAGDFYLVASGLEEGEEVVITGAFKIDSSLQIQGRPSLMTAASVHAAETALAEAGAIHDHHDHVMAAPGASDGAAPSPDEKNPAFIKTLPPVFEAYFKLQEALARDDLATSQAAAKAMDTALGGVGMENLYPESHDRYMTFHKGMKEAAGNIASAAGIDAARKAFKPLSTALIQVDAIWQPLASTPHFVAHCPMADGNKGGDWLQTGELIANPYFGSGMLRCGDLTEARGGATIPE